MSLKEQIVALHEDPTLDPDQRQNQLDNLLVGLSDEEKEVVLKETSLSIMTTGFLSLMLG